MLKLSHNISDCKNRTYTVNEPFYCVYSTWCPLKFVLCLAMIQSVRHLNAIWLQLIQMVGGLQLFLSIIKLYSRWREIYKDLFPSVSTIVHLMRKMRRFHLLKMKYFLSRWSCRSLL